MRTFSFTRSFASKSRINPTESETHSGSPTKNSRQAKERRQDALETLYATAYINANPCVDKKRSKSKRLTPCEPFGMAYLLIIFLKR